MIALLAVPASSQETQQPAVQRPAPRLTQIETIKRFLPRVGAVVDQAKSSGDLIVSNYTHPRGTKITLVIQHKRDKSLLGFYIYNFGSVKGVTNREPIYKYLLSTNDAITIGSFFVDDEDDIGYKYLMSSEQPPNLAVFHSVYLTMAAVTVERRGEISKLLESASDK